jgi:hypothetical protein
MRLALLLALTVALPGVLPAETTAVKTESFAIIHVDDLAGLLAAPTGRVAVFDANPGSVRAANGVIPGAHLLPSSVAYEVAKELPPDETTTLVFYCANVH